MEQVGKVAATTQKDEAATTTQDTLNAILDQLYHSPVYDAPLRVVEMDMEADIRTRHAAVKWIFTYADLSCLIIDTKLTDEDRAELRALFGDMPPLMPREQKPKITLWVEGQE